MAKSFYTDGVGNQQTLTNSQDEKVVIYDTLADAQSDLSNLEEGQIIGTKGVINPLLLTDTVQSGNTNAVTSGGVYNALQNVSIPVYATLQDAETDLPNLEAGQVIGTEQGGNGITDSVTDGDMRAVTSNAVFDGFLTLSKTIKYKDVKTGNITIGSDGYQDISSYKPSGMNNFLFALLLNFGTVSTHDAINITCDGLWVTGTGGASMNYIEIRYIYTD